jgi:uncharacterized protein with PIN domain
MIHVSIACDEEKCDVHISAYLTSELSFTLHRNTLMHAGWTFYQKQRDQLKRVAARCPDCNSKLRTRAAVLRAERVKVGRSF